MHKNRAFKIGPKSVGRRTQTIEHLTSRNNVTLFGNGNKHEKGLQNNILGSIIHSSLIYMSS